jgi:4-amino-4-deoxy-L-arabinose transferase-like glycosyltransferase
LWGVFAGLLLVGMVLRLMDLTDQPLDFHPMPQLHRVMIAREMFYRSTAGPAISGQPTPDAVQASVGAYEPPILERLVATSYLLAGGEFPWIVRLWNALFWLIAALLLFDLARKATSLEGGLVSLAYMLILPFGVQVSRAFMPDSLMVLMIVAAGYALLRWDGKGTWAWALAAGAAAGAAILVKGRIAPMVLMTVIVVGLSQGRWKRLLREPQLWTVGALTLAIPAVYYVLLIPGETAGWVSEGTLNVLGMIVDPSFYTRWMAFLDQIVYLGVALLAAFGTVLLPAGPRRLALGWWVGFLAYGLLLPYNMVTHNYYNLPVVPAIALGLAPVGQALFERLRGLSIGWKAFAVAVGLLMVFYPAWRSRSVIVGNDYRAEPAGWRRIGRELPTDGSIIAITQDYGYRLAYYGGRSVSLWPSVADQAYAELRGHNTSNDIAEVFANQAGGFRYFLVTNFGELDAQPALKAMLYARYPVVAEDESYLLFDLEPASEASPAE